MRRWRKGRNGLGGGRAPPPGAPPPAAGGRRAVEMGRNRAAAGPANTRARPPPFVRSEPAYFLTAVEKSSEVRGLATMPLMFLPNTIAGGEFEIGRPGTYSFISFSLSFLYAAVR